MEIPEKLKRVFAYGESQNENEQIWDIANKALNGDLDDLLRFKDIVFFSGIREGERRRGEEVKKCWRAFLEAIGNGEKAG